MVEYLVDIIENLVPFRPLRTPSIRLFELHFSTEGNLVALLLMLYRLYRNDATYIDERFRWVGDATEALIQIIFRIFNLQDPGIPMPLIPAVPALPILSTRTIIQDPSCPVCLKDFNNIVIPERICFYNGHIACTICCILLRNPYQHHSQTCPVCQQRIQN
jgi:hypothetical protein